MKEKGEDSSKSSEEDLVEGWIRFVSLLNVFWKEVYRLKKESEEGT